MKMSVEPLAEMRCQGYLMLIFVVYATTCCLQSFVLRVVPNLNKSFFVLKSAYIVVSLDKGLSLISRIIDRPQ